MNIRYLLGIDGGGTKTEFLLTDLDGEPVNRWFLGESNPVNVGIERTKSVLKIGTGCVCVGIRLSEVSVFAGIAGSGSKEIRDELSSFLGSFGFGAYASGCDTDSTLQLALNGGNGVAVIMGTGIIAIGSYDGETCRTGGRGYLIDKGGSGFCIGSDALNSAFEYFDGRGGSEIIFELIERRLGKPLADSIGDIYSGGASYVASFAPIVFDAYEKGDPVAESIIDRNAREAAKIIKAAYNFSGGKAVICGGLVRKKHIIEPFLRRYLGKEFPLEFTDIPAVEGAVALAKKNIR